MSHLDQWPLSWGVPQEPARRESVCSEAPAEAPDEPDTQLPNVTTWTYEAGDSTMRLTIVHSGFGGAQACLGTPLLSQACMLAARRAAPVGRHSLYLALVG